MKKDLLHKVIKWLDEDKERGHRALEISAAEIISDLKEIEISITSG